MSKCGSTYEGYLLGSTNKHIYATINAADIDIASKKLLNYYDQHSSEFGELMDMSIGIPVYWPHRNRPNIEI